MWLVSSLPVGEGDGASLSSLSSLVLLSEPVAPEVGQSVSSCGAVRGQTEWFKRKGRGVRRSSWWSWRNIWQTVWAQLSSTDQTLSQTLLWWSPARPGSRLGVDQHSQAPDHTQLSFFSFVSFFDSRRRSTCTDSHPFSSSEEPCETQSVTVGRLWSRVYVWLSATRQ